MNAQQILQKLVSISSVSGNETEIQAWITSYLKQLGLAPQAVQKNVVCQILGKDKTKAIILNGHVDTIDAGNEQAWDASPLSGKVIGDKLYGLGASDMKSGLAVMLVLADTYSKHKPLVDIWLQFVVQEETSGQGSSQVMADFEQNHLGKYKSIAGILLEPTDLESIRIAHKGNIFLEIATVGEGGIGAEPGVAYRQAINLMFGVKRQLEELVASWGELYNDRLLGSPTIALTSIQAGSRLGPNKIADRCTATFDLRTTPQIHEQALALIKETLGTDVIVSTVYDPLPCGYTAPHEHIVTVAKAVTGLPLSVTPGSNDLLFFTALDIPAILFGPGEAAMQHKSNEYALISKVDQAVALVAGIIDKWHVEGTL